MKDRLLGFDALLTAALLGLIAYGALKPLDDPDLWWHLAAGERILGGHGMPWVDPYSYVGKGAAWMAYSWLPEVLFVGTLRAGGPGALVVLSGLLLTATMLVVLDASRVSARHRVALVATLAAVVASWPCWTPRPHLVSFLCMAVFNDVLVRERAGAPFRRWLLVPTMVVWANSHVLFVLGGALLGIHALTRPLAWWRDARNPALLAAVGAATLATPYGWHLLHYVVVLAREPAAFRLVGEFQTPSLHEPTGFAIVAVVFATVAALIHSPRRKDPAELLGVFGFAFLALLMVRNAPFFAVVVAPVLARHLEALAPAPASPAPPLAPAQRAAHGVMLAGAAAWLVVHVAGFFAPGAATREDAVPATAVRWLHAHPVEGRLLNGFNWGGYLIRHLYPRYEVAMDGRTNVYSDQVLTEYLAMTSLAPGWRAFIDRTDPGIVLWERETPFARVLALLPEWRLAYEDDIAVIYVRRSRGPTRS